MRWNYLTPNSNNDWLNQRNPNFMNFIALGDKKKREKESIFLDNYASGLSTNRDVWVYNFSKEEAISNANRMIDFYNKERSRCNQQFEENVGKGISLADIKTRETYLQNIRSNDETKISWSAGLFRKFCNDEKIYPSNCARIVSYRPFCKKYLSYNTAIIERPSRWESIFPEETVENYVICVSGAPIKKKFSILISNCIQDLHFMENSACFPMYFYDKIEDSSQQMSLFDLVGSSNLLKGPKYKKRNAISDAALKKFQEVYGRRVDKESIFYYVYAVLQHKDYISNYGDNLSKEMPRIPMLDNFTEYVRIGKELAAIHLNYEKPENQEDIGLQIEKIKDDYSVTKMRFAKAGKEVQKDTIIYNEYITIRNIPNIAYDYVINGKSAIEWVMERYAITQDKNSRITDNPNNPLHPTYILDLLISVINVSIKTEKLIDELPTYKEI